MLTLLLPLKALCFSSSDLLFRLRCSSCAFLTALALASYSEFALIVVKFMVGNGQLDSNG
ncbi:MAG: hypothetical protein R3F44_09365 [Candidatus Competibacteraceae bacterium]